MYKIELTDSTTTAEMPTLDVPLTQTILEGATDVTTLDMNMYTDFYAQKNQWTHTWRFMSESDFTILKGFYERQFSLKLYPSLTITDLGVEDVVVRMYLSPQSIIDNCGEVEDVQVTFRETVQLSIPGSS